MKNILKKHKINAISMNERTKKPELSDELITYICAGFVHLGWNKFTFIYQSENSYKN
jgi:hypothetical protein